MDIKEEFIDFHVATLKTQANNIDSFSIKEFADVYCGTPIFDMRMQHYKKKELENFLSTYISSGIQCEGSQDVEEYVNEYYKNTING